MKKLHVGRDGTVYRASDLELETFFKSQRERSKKKLREKSSTDDFSNTPSTSPFDDPIAVD